MLAGACIRLFHPTTKEQNSHHVEADCDTFTEDPWLTPSAEDARLPGLPHLLGEGPLASPASVVLALSRTSFPAEGGVAEILFLTVISITKILARLPWASKLRDSSAGPAPAAVRVRGPAMLGGLTRSLQCSPASLV